MDMLETPVGEIAIELPGSTSIFRRHGIDFCCGGKRSLREACERKGVAPEAVLGELSQFDPRRSEVADHARMPTDALIGHILSEFHDKHRRDLPELVALAEKVERVHADKPDCPKGLTAALREAEVELDAHMKKEELILFPMVLRGAGAAATGPIAVMELEHQGHAERLARIERLAHAFVPPEGACNSWRALYSGTRRFVDDVMEHVHLENNVLFPRVLGAAGSRSA